MTVIATYPDTVVSRGFWNLDLSFYTVWLAVKIIVVHVKSTLGSACAGVNIHLSYTSGAIYVILAIFDATC